MRVIGGKLTGRKLFYLKEKKIRPTKNIVRKAIFDSLKGEIENKRVLDIFAGTGALGIEAISYGAKEVVFVEFEKRAVEIIKKNILNLNIMEKATIIRENVEKALNHIEEKKFGLILLDPPYNYPDEKLLFLLNMIWKNKILEEKGIIVVEHSVKKKIPYIEGFEIYKEKKYGNTAVSFLKEANGER